MRYADPKLCPDCRSALPAGISVCPTCDLLVRHPIAIDLFGTLQQADTLLADLRVATTAFHARPTAVSAVAAPTGIPGLGGPMVPPSAPVEPKRASSVPAPPPLPAAPTVPPARGGVAFASVPKILLGLGAFCLLVAAIIFLAVSWSSLGVGGRTAVLAGVTLAAGAAALLLHRIGLRVAGESLVVVALGMLALDVVGAGSAGWFGDASDGTIIGAAGIVTAVAGVLLGLVRISDRPRLVAPQIIAGIALLVADAALAGVTGHPLIVGHVITALGIGLVVLGSAQRQPALLWSAGSAAALIWFATAFGGLLEALDDPSLHELWVEGAGWSLLLTAAALVVPGLVARHHQVLLAGASCTAMIVTAVVTLPSIDAGAATVGLVALATTALWVLALGLLPRSFRTIAIAPAGVGSLILTGFAFTTVAIAVARWQHVAGGYSRPFDVRLLRPAPLTEPLLLVPSLLVVVAFVALLIPARGRQVLGVWLRIAGLLAGVGVAATLASYDVALALPVAVLALVALAAVALTLTSTGLLGNGLAVAAAVIAGAAALVATPNETLALAVTAPLAAALLAIAVLGQHPRRKEIGGLATPPLLALAVAAGVHVAGGGSPWVSVPILLAVGLLALALPRLDVELSAIVVSILTLPVSLTTAADPGALASVWLTVAGFLACATALLHESRRMVAFAGSALLLLATWVRLDDLGVREPEPYTLPLAIGLLAFGLWRMQHSSEVGTAQALLPGLLLGTTPSLLWVLGDPVSLRALVLGAACLALTIAGAALRWSAPLVVGATVGAAIVLREIGPYAGDFPKWVWIGLAGALLTVVGITWERQLLEVRKAVGFIGRLR
ncbi:hypothetical protein GCM10022237_05250 [Nocardioides ginsengisoli]|uniref:SCO7613 C-terminal domain-containing membrane protein n=1 Tax=Nocardioides ginsengisoli TaxID=363868 RepID=A0ABW3VYB3_9ACTN